MLDEGRFNDWFGLLAEDLSYEMPVRRTVLRRQGLGIEPSTPWFHENLESIRIRIRRVMESDKAYSEDPPSRTRHIVSNVGIYETEVQGQYLVQSYLFLTRNRGETDTYEFASADREDIIRIDNESIKLAKRTITIDQARLGMQNLAVFF
jgi:3-phenylpropionate/cinnamic acid dioxygenase small subunit